MQAQALPGSMAAMVFDGPGQALRAARLPLPVAGERDVLIRVSACAVCRTDLHIVDGDLAPHRRPLVPGHEIVGTVVDAGRAVTRFALGQRVGVPWLGSTCRHCRYCLSHRENLCDQPVFTGYDRDGGYAEYAAADEDFCFALPARYDDLHAAPLLCAGLIGYRAYAMAAPDGALGIYGFGAAAHLVTQLAVHAGRTVYAFTRPGDLRSQHFARSLGAAWAGNSQQAPPALLDAAIIFAADGALVRQALAASAKGASVVCAGIHMSDIPPLPYALLWGERCVRSVANLTRADGERFLALAARHQLAAQVTPFPLAQANDALAALRAGSFDGAAVLVPG
jgi:propanol-preferring alcohol dehydrogenase